MLIKTVFRIVSGKYKISRLSGINQTITNYLLKNEARIEDNEFTRMVMLFLSRYIYCFIIHPTFKLDFKRKLLNPTTPQLNRIAKWLRRKLIRQPFPYEWLKKLDEIREEFEENYQKLRTRLRLDQIFSCEYLTNLRNLAQFVFNLVVGKFKFSELEGFYREVANYLGGLKTFLYDEELSYNFKWSFIIVICRIVYDTIVNQGYFKKPKAEREKIRVDLTENDSIGIKLNVSESEIKYKYFEEVNLVSRKEFAEYYKKLQFRLNLDQIYGLAFIAEIKHLTTIVFDLIEGKCGKIPSTNYIHFIGEDLLRNWDANLNHKWIPKATLSREPISQLMLNEKIEEYNKDLMKKDMMTNNKNDDFNEKKESITNSGKDNEFTEDNLSSFNESREICDNYSFPIQSESHSPKIKFTNNFNEVFDFYKRSQESILKLKKYAKINEWDCKKSKNSKIIRHLYEIRDYRTLGCTHKDCNKVLQLTDKELENSIHTKTQEEMREVDQNSKHYDISIYRIKLKEKYLKELEKIISKKLVLEKGYVGQSKSVIKINKEGGKPMSSSRWYGHLFEAFNFEEYSIILDSVIRKYSIAYAEYIYGIRVEIEKDAEGKKFFKDPKHYELCRKVADQIFEIDILQVIKEEDFEVKTHDIADNAEMFWIGFFHSQFEEYGWNITEGGYSAGVTSWLNKDDVLKIMKKAWPFEHAAPILGIGKIGLYDFVQKKWEMTYTEKMILIVKLFYTELQTQGLSKSEIIQHFFKFKSSTSQLYEFVNSRFKIQQKALKELDEGKSPFGLYIVNYDPLYLWGDYYDDPLLEKALLDIVKDKEKYNYKQITQKLSMLGFVSKSGQSLDDMYNGVRIIKDMFSSIFGKSYLEMRYLKYEPLMRELLKDSVHSASYSKLSAELEVRTGEQWSIKRVRVYFENRWKVQGIDAARALIRYNKDVNVNGQAEYDRYFKDFKFPVSLHLNF